EYRRFAEFGDACRRYRYIGLCYGPPGVGKTLSTQHYAHWDVIRPVVEDFPEGPVPAVVADCHTVVYTPPVANNPRGIETAVRSLRSGLEYAVELLANPDTRWSSRFAHGTRTELLIVDEADRLKTLGLEQ